MRTVTTLLAGMGVIALCLGVLAVREEAQPVAAASGPCVTTYAAVTTAEWNFFQSINSWRMAQLDVPSMTLNHSANEAAQWFAEALAAGQAYGHEDAYGRSWADRLRDCGYDPSWAGASGEAFAVAPSASAAFSSMTSDTPGHSNGVQAPVDWKCAGVGVSGNAWVVVVAQYSFGAPCPEAVTGPAAPTNTPATPSPTVPQPSATPVHRSYVPGLQRD